MRHLAFVVVSVCAVFCVVMGMSAPASAQATSNGESTFLTPWGDPDLQGVWANDTSTPLERPTRFEGQSELTAEELASFTAERQGSRDEWDRRDYGSGNVTDVGRAYNAYWFPIPGNPISRTSLIVDPPDGRVPPLTQQARGRFAAFAETKGLFNTAANPEGSLWNGGRTDSEPEDGTQGGVDGRGSRADNPEDRRLSERCILWNPLPRLPGGYNNHFQIVQSPGYVTIGSEMIHHTRVVPLDGRSHRPQNVRQWIGDSRGHWEGDTLVVDTTNFTDKAPFRGSFEGLHLVERFTRVDAETVSYEVTVDDPTTWARSWTAAYPLTNLRTLVGGVDEQQVPQMFEYACHEGNYGLSGQLSGSRAVEQDAEKATRQQ